MSGGPLSAKAFIVAVKRNLRGRPRVRFACIVGWLLIGPPLTAQSQPVAELPAELIAQARESFQPVTEDHVLQAVSRVRDGLHAVEKYVGTEGQKATAWKRYLAWEKQIDRLNRNGGPDARFWMRVYRHVARNEAGLEHASFQQYRQAVRELSHVMAAANSPALSEDFETTLNQLAALLQSPREMPEADRADQISVLLGDLARQRQAGKLIGALRRQYDHPNVVLKLPASLLQRMRHEPIEVDFPVNESVGGAAVRGKSHMSATRSLSLVPSTSRLELRFTIAGTTYSTTTGTKDRVTVNTTGVLPFVSATEVVFGKEGFTRAPFKTRAHLRTQITGISSDYRLRIRENAGAREAYARQEADRREAERNAIAGLSAFFDKQLSSTIGRLQHEYRQQIHHPLVRLDRLPDEMRFRTEAGAATAEMLFADSTQLGARRPADLSGDSALLRCSVHQSAINNFATLLSDQTEVLDMALRRFLLNDPQSANPAASESLAKTVAQSSIAARDPAADQQLDPVWITFADRRPLAVGFQDDEMTLSLSGKAYRYRKQRYAGMDIILRYRLKAAGATPEFVLSESPDVRLPMRSDGGRPQGGVRTVTLRRILTNVLERDVPKSIVLDKFPLPQRSSLLGEFAIERITINDGWLTLDARPTELRE